MAKQSATALFTEFEASSYEKWLAAACESLPDKAFDRIVKHSYEGFEVQPLAHSQDMAGISHLDALPGQFPYVRGTRAAGYRSQAWLIAQDIGLSDLRRFNQALVHALANGQTAIYLDSKLPLNRIEDLEIAFADIDLTKYPLLIQAETGAARLYRWLSAWLKGDALQQIHGCLGADPLNTLVRSGSIASDAFEQMAAFVQLADRQSPRLDTIAVATDVYHDAGASAVQEMALAMAAAVAYLREMEQRGLDVELVAGKIWFFMRVGENFFMEVAKFRAIKMMWAQIAAAFGGSAAVQKIKLHASAASRNKTRHDVYVNMLRVTVEAMAAAVGGVDSLQVAPFDAALGESSEFSRRIARNVQFILQEEVRLIDLIDPAGGAWHVEKLTDQLAKSAWSLFQQIEAQGGLVEALQAGSIQTQITSVADRRRQDLAEGRTALVGCSRYPNLDESRPEDRSRPQQSAAVGDVRERIEVKPLRARRLAVPYEDLRRNADMYRRRKGHRPRIFLANFGRLGEYKIGADFARGLYEPGGFELIDDGGYDSIESALEAAISSQAAAVVICTGDSSDAAFVSEYVRALKAQQPQLIVIFAGEPKNQESQDGIDDFIYHGVNAYETNRALQGKLGIGA